MKKILLGVTGSVAAIKVAQLVESLHAFAEIKIVMTQAAQYFLAADLLTLQQLDIAIYHDQDEWPPLPDRYVVGKPILHIELRRWADCMLIAPLDANTLAKIANGLCDNLLTSVARAWDWQHPLLLCPAMNTMMWESPLTARHLQQVRELGATVIDPIAKRLACQDVGMGAMEEVGAIVDFVRTVI